MPVAKPFSRRATGLPCSLWDVGRVPAGRAANWEGGLLWGGGGVENRLAFKGQHGVPCE